MNIKKNFDVSRGARRLTIIILICITASCTKNAAGPKGETGTSGKNGNSNQSHSVSSTLSSSEWSFIQSDNIWEATLYVEYLTGHALANGEITVYVEKDDSWWTLPYGRGLDFIRCSAKPGVVTVYYSNLHGGTPTRPDPMNFRTVVIDKKL
jgi:hypothetical protein